MKELLFTTLEKVCKGKVYQQGTFLENEEYPEKFITFFTDSTEDNSHYDNDATSVDWNFSVMFYSTDPAEVATVPNTIVKELKAAGFVPQGKGFDLICDRPTHTGWAMDFVITEEL